MAIKPEIPKDPVVRVKNRDLKAKKDPKGGAQKKEIDLGGLADQRTDTADSNRLNDT